jgi:hypothetical protein
LRFRLLLLLLLLSPADLFAGSDPLRSQTVQIFPLPLDGTIDLENIDGSIYIYGWYQPRVRVAALRNAYTAPRLQQIRVETKAQPASLEIRTIIPPEHGLFADRSGTVDYTLNVPETAHLKLKLSSGEVSVQGLRGGQAEIALTNGRVFAINCYARIEAHSVTGAMDVFYEWWENASAMFTFTLQHGRIGAHIPAVAQFRVDAQTTAGNIGDDFHLKTESSESGETLKGATRPDAPVSFRFRTGGNISIDSFR